MKIYLAGPMRGLPMFNFPAFMEAAIKLRDRGHFVYNPAERDVAVGFDPSKPLDHPDNTKVFNLAEAFEWDFVAINKSEAIVLLPGWANSKGVQAELVLAMALHRGVFEWDDPRMVPLGIMSYSVNFELAPDHIERTRLPPTSPANADV